MGMRRLFCGMKNEILVKGEILFFKRLTLCVRKNIIMSDKNTEFILV